ncbi:unnamed protein product [Cochlearia groenlandica]
MSEEEQPLTEEEQQLLNDMCKHLDEMRIQSIRHAEEQTKLFVAMQDSLGAIHENLNEIQVHGRVWEPGDSRVRLEGKPSSKIYVSC